VRSVSVPFPRPTPNRARDRNGVVRPYRLAPCWLLDDLRHNGPPDTDQLESQPK